MWFSDKLTVHHSAIGYMPTGNHTFAEFTVPTQNAYVQGIAVGPNHTVWFTEWLTCKVGKIDTTSGQVSEYSVPSPCDPSGITLGSDGAMWFTSGFSIDRITASGALSEYSIGQNEPADVTTGPDGAIWFSGLSDQYGAMIGRIDVHTYVRKIAKYGAGGGGTVHIVTRGSDLWMTATDANKIDRYDPQNHTVYRRSLPKGYTAPLAITLGLDNRLWFTNRGPKGIAIGKLCPEMNSQQCKTSP